MNRYGFNDEHEALMSEYRPLIDARRVQYYPRKRNHVGIVITIVVLLIISVVLL